MLCIITGISSSGWSSSPILVTWRLSSHYICSIQFNSLSFLQIHICKCLSNWLANSRQVVAVASIVAKLALAISAHWSYCNRQNPQHRLKIDDVQRPPATQFVVPLASHMPRQRFGIRYSVFRTVFFRGKDCVFSYYIFTFSICFLHPSSYDIRSSVK